MDDLGRHTWTETEDKIYFRTFESDRGDLLYVEDTLDDGTQYSKTELEDFCTPRYVLKLDRAYTPDKSNDKVLDTYEDASAAEEFISDLNDLEVV
jgi:hypothetical protein